MPEPVVSTIYRSDRRGLRQVENLLRAEGIRRDRNLDYTCAVYDAAGAMIATGSCYANTLRCLAVAGEHRGEALLNTVVTHLMQVQFARGNTRVFVYTKTDAAPLIGSLGFYEIARVPERVVFLENRRDGFSGFLARLATTARPGRVISGIVMNANPFSRGHLFLAEKAARESDVVHLFVVSEDASAFPAAVRKRLVIEGTRHLANVVVHDTDSYMVSNATFPSYFSADEDAATRAQAELDLAVFGKIAQAVGINRRYVGSEPTSHVTNLYNQTMHACLPPLGIECVEVPRVEVGGRPVSASTIRQALHDGDRDLVQQLVPPTTWDFLTSPAAEPILRHLSTTHGYTVARARFLRDATE